MPGSVCSLPEPRKCCTVGRLAQLLECTLADLANTLACHSHERADLLQCHRIRSLLEAVVQMENLSFARGQVFPEDLVDELLHEVEIGHFLDLRSVDAGESLAQRARFAVTAIDWRVERDFGGAHLLR